MRGYEEHCMILLLEQVYNGVVLVLEVLMYD